MKGVGVSNSGVGGRYSKIAHCSCRLLCSTEDPVSKPYYGPPIWVGVGCANYFGSGWGSFFTISERAVFVLLRVKPSLIRLT